MLKHCSPSSVDLSRRSRRHLVQGGEMSSCSDSVSLQSSNDNSSSSSSSSSVSGGDNSAQQNDNSSSPSQQRNDNSVIVLVENDNSPPAEEEERDRVRIVVPNSSSSPVKITFKDASTSPRSSPLTYRRTRGARKAAASTATSNAKRSPAKSTPLESCVEHPAPKGATTAVTVQRGMSTRDDSHCPRVPVKIYASCLRSDIEYKTLSATHLTTSRELIWVMLGKFKMKHRDPKLFYLTMDINIKRTGIPLKRSLALEEDARPVELKGCHPWGECKFTLQMRKGGVVRIYDSVLMAESKYKCLLVSENTTAEEVIRMLFHLYGLEHADRPDRYCVYEQNPSREYERRLAGEDRPMQVQSSWANPMHFMFVLRLSPEDDDACQANNSSVVRVMVNGNNNNSEEDEDCGLEEEDSSEYSVLRFGSSSNRESPESDSSTAGCSTSSSADSGVSKSPPEEGKNRRPTTGIKKNNNGGGDKKSSSSVTLRPAATYVKNRTRQQQLQLQMQQQHNQRNLVTVSRREVSSLHSLLEALPAASVDTGLIDGGDVAAPPVCADSKRTSVSSVSLDSARSSAEDFDSYFYI